MIYVQVLLENVYNVHIHMNNMTYFFNGILSSVNPRVFIVLLISSKKIVSKKISSKKIRNAVLIYVS